MLFKPAMIVPGAESPKEPAEKVAKYTLDVMKETIPPTMAGITFLSGGQSEEEATQHIQAMAKYMPDAPWNVSFSFARGLPGERAGSDGPVHRRDRGSGSPIYNGISLRE